MNVLPPSIGLAVARHRATDPTRRLGILPADAGGPGSSGAEFPKEQLRR
jgi:hypothetical protein